MICLCNLAAPHLSPLLGKSSVQLFFALFSLPFSFCLFSKKNIQSDELSYFRYRWAAGVERLVLGLRNDLDEYRRRPLFGIVINSMDEDDNRVESDRMVSFEKSAMLISTGIR